MQDTQHERTSKSHQSTDVSSKHRRHSICLLRSQHLAREAFVEHENRRRLTPQKHNLRQTFLSVAWFVIIVALLDVASLFVCGTIHCKHLRLSDANKLKLLTYLLTYFKHRGSVTNTQIQTLKLTFFLYFSCSLDLLCIVTWYWILTYL